LTLYPNALSEEGFISRDTFKVLADSRPSGIRSIFPRLRSLEFDVRGLGWLSDAIKGDLIFHEGIQSVTFTGMDVIEDPDEDEVSATEEYDDLVWSRQLLSEMVTLSPNIKFLHIPLDELIIGNMKRALCDALTQLTQLEGFSCSFAEIINTKLVLALKNHQSLRTVTASKPICGVARQYDLPHEEAMSYPSLETLHLVGSPTDISTLFVENEPQFPSLTRLKLFIVMNDGRGHIHDILSNISSHCPNLLSLQLSFIRRDYDHPQLRITANDLWSLRRLKHLSSLRIARVEELVVEDAELAQLIANLPQLKVLHFEQEHFGNADRAYRLHRRSTDCPPRLTLNLLVLLSNTPNQLEELSVRVSAISLAGVGRLVNRLKTLKVVWFVRSQLPSCDECIRDVSLFLATVLSRTCAIGIDCEDSSLKKRWGTAKQYVRYLDLCDCSLCRSDMFRHSHYLHGTHPVVPWANGN
jgi:hypothetical protein